MFSNEHGFHTLHNNFGKIDLLMMMAVYCRNS
jgi:hypothetical protein